VVLIYLLTGPPGRLDTGDKIASVAALFLTAAGMVLSNSQQAVEQASVSLDAAADELAGCIRRQWERETGLRLLGHVQPMALRWRRRPDVTSATVTAEVETTSPDLDNCQDIGDLLRSSPVGRLVLLGRAGSGKTTLAMQLTLALTNSRQPGGPVPVLLSLSSWDPAEHIDLWLERRLIEEYPALTKKPKSERISVLELIQSGHIFPVLDGLDEMSATHQSRVLQNFNTILCRHRFVLTCRSDAYLNLVAEAGTALLGALVAELMPLLLNRLQNSCPLVPSITVVAGDRSSRHFTTIPADHWPRRSPRL